MSVCFICAYAYVYTHAHICIYIYYIYTYIYRVQFSLVDYTDMANPLLCE